MSDANTPRDEDTLIASLRNALDESDGVPSDVTEFAKAAFSWREIDARLAELEFDSMEENTPTGVRSSATARMMSFQAGQWMLDVEYDDAGQRLIGAISPETAYTVEIHAAGTYFTTESDDAGRFQADGVPSGPLSLVLHIGGGPVVKTQWVVL